MEILKECGQKIKSQKKIQDQIKSGKEINSATFQKKYGSIHYAACKLFGSWQNAVEAAGYDYQEINLYSERITWDKDLIIKTILELYYDGIDLMASNIRDNYANLFNGARRCKEIETWENAISLAGLDYSEICGDQWGTKYIGKDNNIYMSITEGMVADKLFELKNTGEIDNYKTQVKVTEERRWTCDFVYHKDSKEIWLEVDGLEKSRKEGVYNEYNEKIAYYKNNNYSYKVINSFKDLDDLIK